MHGSGAYTICLPRCQLLVSAAANYISLHADCPVNVIECAPVQAISMISEGKAAFGIIGYDSRDAALFREAIEEHALQTGLNRNVARACITAAGQEPTGP